MATVGARRNPTFIRPWAHFSPRALGSAGQTRGNPNATRAPPLTAERAPRSQRGPDRGLASPGSCHRGPDAGAARGLATAVRLRMASIFSCSLWPGLARARPSWRRQRDPLGRIGTGPPFRDERGLMFQVQAPDGPPEPRGSAQVVSCVINGLFPPSRLQASLLARQKGVFGAAAQQRGLDRRLIV